MAQNRINQSLEERVSNFWNKASAYTTNMTAFFGRQGSNRPSTLSSSNNTNNQTTVTATVRNFDLDGNGAISNDEVTTQILLDKQFRTSSVGALQARNSNSIVIKQLVDQIDTNNDGTISRHEARVADRAKSTIQTSTGLTNTTLFNGLFNTVLTKESTVVTNTARTSFDLNDDGQITDLEYTSAMAEVAKYLKAAPTAETLAAARSQVGNHAVIIDRLVNSFMQNLGRIEDINPLDLKNWLENIAPNTEGLTGTQTEKMRFVISVLNGLDSNATKTYNIVSTLDRDRNAEYSLDEITSAYTKFKKGDYGNLRANEFDDIVVQTLLGNNSDIDSSNYAEAFSKINNIKQMISTNDTNADGTISDSELIQGLNKVLTQDPNDIATLRTIAYLESNPNFNKIHAISSRLSHYPGFIPTKADMVASILILEKTSNAALADKDLFYKAIGVTDKDNADITALNKALNDNYALTDLDGGKVKDDVLYTKLIKAAKGEISLDKYQVAVLRSNAKYDRINSLVKQYSTKGIFNSTSLAAVLVGASMSTPRISSITSNNEKAILINLIKTATNMTDAQVAEYQKAVDALDPDHDGKLSQEDLVLHNYYFSNSNPQYNFSRNIFDEVSNYLLNNF